MSHKSEKVSSNRILEGTIWDALIMFALPIAFSSLLQQLFNAADQIVVGRFAGSQALAAVGANTPVVNLLVNVFGACSIGANALIARKIGEGRKKEINRIVHTSMAFALYVGVFMVLVGQLVARPLLVLIGTPGDVLEMAVVYLRIYAFAFPFALLFNFGSAILRSTGDTRRPMIALISAGVINVILNLVLVLGFGLGVAGVAAATAVSNLVSGVAVVYMLCREQGDLQLRLTELRIDWGDLGRILQIGGPASLQSAVFSVANVCIQSGINSLGSAAVAGCSVVGNFEFVGYFIANSFSQAAITFCGQNYGARQIDRCKNIIRMALVEGVFFGFVFDMIVVAFRYPLLGLFSTDAAVIEAGNVKMLIVMSMHFSLGVYEILGASMRSMGQSLTPALLTIVGCVAFRIMWLLTVFHAVPTLTMLMWVYPASWTVTSVLTVGYYFMIRKKLFEMR